MSVQCVDMVAIFNLKRYCVESVLVGQPPESTILNTVWGEIEI